MKYVWNRKVFGRKEGQVEELDVATEPRLVTWIAAELVSQETKTKPPKKAERLAIPNEE